MDSKGTSVYFIVLCLKGRSQSVDHNPNLVIFIEHEW